MRKTFLILAVALSGCGQSPQEAAQAARDCRAHGGTPRMFYGADWRPTRPDGQRNQYVRCMATYSSAE